MGAKADTDRYLPGFLRNYKDIFANRKSCLHQKKTREWVSLLSRRRRWTTHQSQSAVPAHAVSEDADSVRIQLFEVVEDGLWQFRCDVAVHLIPFVPGRFRRIDVKACTRPEIIRVVFALDL